MYTYVHMHVTCEGMHTLIYVHFVYIHTCGYMYTDAGTYRYTHTHTVAYVYKQTHMHEGIYIWYGIMCMRPQTHRYTYTHGHAHRETHVLVCTHVYLCVYLDLNI